jgi:hypothetical protein
MTKTERRLGIALAFILASCHGTQAFAQGGCTAGVSLVACAATKRTFTVSQNGTGNYKTIQAALTAAAPGDTILVRAGTYVEPVVMQASGTADAPIMLKAFAGERPVLRPTIAGATSYVALLGSWLVLEGFEITGGHDGIVVVGSHNIVRGNYVHDNGQGCADEICGQGIIVASATDVLLENNQIERNGLSTKNPWLVHGIYLSDYYGRPITRISIMGNVIREHAGGGLQIWDAHNPITTVLIQNNRFENNTMEVILTNLQGALFKQNQFSHLGHPRTNAPRTAMLWLEFCLNLTFDSNVFTYDGVTTDGIPSEPIHAYSSDQKFAELQWRSNRWVMPAAMPVTDALLNSIRP